MKLRPPRRSSCSEAIGWIERGARYSTIATLAVTLGACSGSNLADTGFRQPSLRLADAALASGAPDLALRVAELTISRNPRDVRAHIARGDALYALGQQDIAQVAYRAAIALDPGAVGAQLGLGRTLVRSDPQAAEAAFLVVLHSEPNNVLALNNLGVVRALQGRNAEAQDAYRKALLISPESADVRVNLGMSLAIAGNTSEAVPLLRAVVTDLDAAHKWHDDLLAALTIAGDGVWARQALTTDVAQSRAAIANEHTANTSDTVLPSTDLTSVRTVSRDTTSTAPTVNTAPSTGLVVPETLTAVAPASISVAPAGTLAPEVPEAKQGSMSPMAAGKPISASQTVTEINARRSVLAGRTYTSRSPDATIPLSEPTQRNAGEAPAAAPKSGLAGEQSGTSDGDPFVQLASLLSETDAMTEWRRLGDRMQGLFDGLEPKITPVEVGGRMYWRLRAVGLNNARDAKELCNLLRDATRGCWSGRGL